MIGLYIYIEVKIVLEKKYISVDKFEKYFSFCFIWNFWDYVILKFFEFRKSE